MVNKKNSIIKILGFGVLLLLMITVLSMLSTPVKWFDQRRIQNRNARIVALMKEPAGNIDVINLGDSLSLSGFSPMELWRASGITSFDAGADGLRLPEAYYATVEAVEMQHPKVLMLETLLLFRYSVKQDNQMILSQPLYHRFAFLKYHSLWKTFVEPLGIRVYHKGYLVNENVGPYEGDPDYMDDDVQDGGRVFIPDFNKRWLGKIKKYCDENGVQLVLYSMASAKGYNHERVDSIEEISDELGICYLDLNSREDLSIDWQTDTNDGGDHLNLFGARKAAVVVADFLFENTKVTDHRGEAAYASWDEELAEYDELVKEMVGKSFQDLTDERRQKVREQWKKDAGRTDDGRTRSKKEREKEKKKKEEAADKATTAGGEAAEKEETAKEQ